METIESKIKKVFPEGNEGELLLPDGVDTNRFLWPSVKLEKNN